MPGAAVAVAVAVVTEPLVVAVTTMVATIETRLDSSHAQPPCPLVSIRVVLEGAVVMVLVGQ